ncbi:uncharacterized protein LAESUDRAFT_559559 [Laetiporus sulphureus 93-53]|uniref:Uncharacterized protein n=1 Tax=Laetiporus sulphureus 93-53 TaxID=1314785 RepID=A0A165B582_9APHY|nr:uncharacterized protein LAESUDRAFT_559559 [Laetiporus sulphureus 93-53]KZT00266.1 hypothetical protein LAESUDRAFT_559559 [Laetiporus sulphureus 93-53]
MRRLLQGSEIQLHGRADTTTMQPPREAASITSCCGSVGGQAVIASSPQSPSKVVIHIRPQCVRATWEAPRMCLKAAFSRKKVTLRRRRGACSAEVLREVDEK